MKKDFINYIKQEFWFDDKEVEKFENSLNTPLKKSIRVNTNKISVSDFKLRAEKNNWTLTPTNLWKNTFYIDRQDSKEVALWNTPKHIAGYFYVQEVAASSSPFFMSEDKIDKTPYLILDMSASPGWKTTQLSEYYPNSLIIANELDKTRLKWFFSNLDRMSSTSVVATNYDGRFFKNTPEIFDKVLLDAPCSWEWTAFKADEALKYWNLKNIKTVSKLQFGLICSAIESLKEDWVLVYSTCTLNKLENEWVIEKALKKYWDSIEVIPLSQPFPPREKGVEQKGLISSLPWGEIERGGAFIRNWPHINNTWWFFVAKIIKVKSLNPPLTPPLSGSEDNSKNIKKWKNNDIKFVRQNIEKVSKTDEKIIHNFFIENFNFDLSPFFLYNYKWEIQLSSKNLNQVWENIFLYKIWVNIWDIKSGEFVPNFYAWTFASFEKNIIKVDKAELYKLLKWEEISPPASLSPSMRGTKGEEFHQIIYNNIEMWLSKVKNSKLKSLISSKKVIN